MPFITEYTTTINDDDTPDAVASKKQFAKRQAFARLNTEVVDETVYIIRTSSRVRRGFDTYGVDGKPIAAPFYEYIYRITLEAWAYPPQLMIEDLNQ